MVEMLSMWQEEKAAFMVCACWNLCGFSVGNGKFILSFIFNFSIFELSKLLIINTFKDFKTFLYYCVLNFK